MLPSSNLFMVDSLPFGGDGVNLYFCSGKKVKMVGGNRVLLKLHLHLRQQLYLPRLLGVDIVVYTHRESLNLNCHGIGCTR